eukprot:Seg848.2 transcript_id=Seg848.2/GoldUCD/mRNA.D3Y31 product="CCA tRNA nucleotidyltransferase 1 mitochondrial" protein_id=Seg848.2/GoldUCD/D3Y31
MLYNRCGSRALGLRTSELGRATSCFRRFVTLQSPTTVLDHLFADKVYGLNLGHQVRPKFLVGQRTCYHTTLWVSKKTVDRPRTGVAPCATSPGNYRSKLVEARTRNLFRKSAKDFWTSSSFYFAISTDNAIMALASSFCNYCQSHPNLSSNKLFQKLLTKELMTVANAFVEKGHHIRIIGGAVRDLFLLKHLPKDVDLAVTATPDEMIEIFKENKIRYIETGLQHGTLTAHLNGHNYEITTLRIDTEHDGRRAVVEFTNDWKLDAERRDLTINAMSLDFDGSLHDYFGGVDDLKSKKVRFVGDPEKRIKEDFLRILRYFRFYGRISENGDDHEKATLEVIRKCAPGLKNIAVERVWVELARIITAKFAPSLLKHMYELGVAGNIGLPPCTQKHLEEFEYVWNHGHAHKLEPVTILMSLVDTVEEAEHLARSMKLSTAERNLGKFIVTHRNLEDKEDPKKPYQDILASCTSVKALCQLQKHVDQLLLYRGLEGIAEELSTWPVPQFPVSGNDLKSVGVKPGPLFGKILHELKELWLGSYYTLGKAELLEKIEHIRTKFH